VTEEPSENRTRWAVLDALPDQAALLDAEGVIIATNQAWKNFAAANGGSVELVDRGVRYLDACVPTEESPEIVDLQAAINEVIRGERLQFLYEYPCHSPTQPRWFMMRAGHVQGGGALVVHTDITGRKLAESESISLANHDPLTRALNRRGLAIRLQQELGRARRNGHRMCAMLLDCDDFKSINSRYGHAAGDLALVEMSKRFCETLRPADAFARIGGDEFVVLLPETNMHEASIVADRLRIASASVPFLLSGDQTASITCSISVALVPEAASGLDEILQLCTEGLQVAKSLGKDRVSHESVPYQRELRALTSDQVRVAHQPIVNLKSLAPVATELLVRGAGVLERPADLFRSAQLHGVLRHVDLVCLNACLNAALKLESTIMAHLNVYPSTLLSVDADYFVERVPNLPDRKRICLELCEQEIVGDPIYLQETVRKMRSLGFKIGLDDVGFGRTCLESLVLLEPEIVKIDRRFVDGVSKDTVKRRQLERTIRVAQTLGAVIVVEGVEQIEDANVCRDLGADQGQGYLWGKPVVHAS
jgi:diguanylate cyclase (GGDEF)-like protein